MSPSLSAFYKRNCGSADFVTSRENMVLFFRLFNLFNLFLRKPRTRMNIAPQVSATTFLSHIYHVVFWGSKKKVIWIYARGVIAFMADKHSTRDFAKVNKPRESVSAYLFAKIAEMPITIFLAACPIPARLSLFNVKKKPDFCVQRGLLNGL